MRLLLLALATTLLAQQPQNPSPTTENTRAHTRLREQTPRGRRETLELGTLFLPPGIGSRPELLIFFHGEPWIHEVAAARNHVALISVVAGNGSGSYEKLFEDPQRFPRLIEEARRRSHLRFRRVLLGGWSAGCGALRQILRDHASYARVYGVMCLDGVHTDYDASNAPSGDPALVADKLGMWVKLAHDAVAGRKKFLMTHSEIFPGTYASTTETADYILKQVGMRARAVLKWGPMGLQQISQASRGRFLVMGYAGNSAPDHVDQLESLPSFLHWLR